VDGRNHRVVVVVVRHLDVLLEQRHHAAHRALGVNAGFLVRRDRLHHDPVETFVFLPLDDARALDPFDQHLDVAAGQLEALDDVRHAPDGEDVGRLRVVDGGVVLHGDENPLVLHQRALEGPDGEGPADHERHHHVREHDHVAEREDREGFGEEHLGGSLEIANGEL
jgi:hypothetical protein